MLKDFCLFFLIAIPMVLYSQTQKAVRLDTPINFDGKVDRQEWGASMQVPLIQFNPSNGDQIKAQTEIFLGYDDDYLYMAGRVFYAHARDVMGQTIKRDIFTRAIDYLGIQIDQFNDNENAVLFATTPMGTRTDWLTFNNAQGGLPLNINWNTFWDVKAEYINDSAWQAEIRIPWSTLRFNVEDGKTVMGIGYFRHNAKTGEDQTPPGMKNTFGEWSLFMPSQFPRYEFEGLEDKRPLYVAPYILGGITQSSELNEGGTAYSTMNETQYNAGLDIKYSPSSNLSMDLTFNTDFAQVEADDQQVNLTRFSLFFPEKRLFFQERSSTFRTVPNTGFSRVFYSRKIGLEEGNTVPIIAGARLVGRIGKWDVGLINMQTSKLNSINSANHSVVRFRKQAFNENSNIGMIMTNKTDFSNGTNVSLGLDGNISMIKKDYLRFGWFSTHNYGANNLGYMDLSKVYLQWQNTGSQGFGYDLIFSRIGEGYDPVMGFEQRNNITNYNPKLWYAWILGPNTAFQNVEIRASSSIFTRNSEGGVIESENHSLTMGYSTKIQAEGSIKINNYYDEVLEAFDLSDDSQIPIGEYRYSNIELNVVSPQGKEFVFTGKLSLGEYYDGMLSSIGATIFWKPTPVINNTFIYEFNEIKAEERGMNFRANIGRLKTELTFDTKWSAAAFYQFSDIAHFSLLNFRLRYNPREGNDFFIVYNEGMNLDRTRELPVLPVTDTRTILLKYTHTFVW